ncbi:hypothetical protein EDD15DRAFT_2519228 [Pisolithus albus]|nr:hypothetical protein EDD15DRAFT_2519228 [Pisolithus albus]
MFQVVDYLRREGNMKGLQEVNWIMLFQIQLREPWTELGDDQAHLQRITLDAGAHTSKYQLLLAARAAEQAKWSGADRGTLAIDDQGTAPTRTASMPDARREQLGLLTNLLSPLGLLTPYPGSSPLSPTRPATSAVMDFRSIPVTSDNVRSPESPFCGAVNTDAPSGLVTPKALHDFF